MSPPPLPSDPTLLRNIGIVAHIDAGKTTLTEQALVLMGVIRRAGAVEDGSTVSDWLRAEQERGITIVSAAVTGSWRGTALTFVDTPGHVDFTVEVERSLTVLDGVVVVLSGPEGVQAQTQTVWHQAARRELPVVGFVNKLDRPGFDDDALQDDVRQRLGIEPLPLQVPLEFGGDRLVLLDVISGERLSWEDAGRKATARPPVRGPLASEDEEVLRQLALERILDRVASHDDDFAAEVLEGRTPEPEAWRRALARAVRARACLPLLYGAARSGIGPGPLLDAVVDLLPSPAEALRPRVYDLETGHVAGPWREHLSGAPAAFVFKTEPRRHGRRIAWLRVFAGELRPGLLLQRLPSGDPWQVPPLVRLLGGQEDPVPVLGPGAIGAAIADAGEPLPGTGETVVLGPERFTFESIRVPTPVIAVGLEAASVEEDSRMRQALEEMTTDDPSLALLADRESGQLLLSGMGELHLELALETLRRDRGLDVRSGPARPRRRRLAARSAEGEGTFSSGAVPRGEAKIAIRLVAGAGGAIAYEAGPPERSDFRFALEAGIVHAVRDEADLVGVDAIVTRIETSGAGLTPAGLWEAARDAARDAVGKAGSREAEPWMALSIVVPDDHVGRVTGDLARRRGRVLGSESRGVLQVLQAEAPLAELLRYATELRSLTGGRASFTMEPLGYRPV